MFEFLLVVASTLIYMRVFPYKPEKRCVATQTEPWYATNVLDLMDVSDSECSVKYVETDLWSTCESSSSEIELLPLLRQRAHGLKESPPES